MALEQHCFGDPLNSISQALIFLYKWLRRKSNSILHQLSRYTVLSLKLNELLLCQFPNLKQSTTQNHRLPVRYPFKTKLASLHHPFCFTRGYNYNTH